MLQLLDLAGVRFSTWHLPSRRIFATCEYRSEEKEREKERKRKGQERSPLIQERMMRMTELQPSLSSVIGTSEMSQISTRKGLFVQEKESTAYHEFWWMLGRWSI